MNEKNTKLFHGKLFDFSGALVEQMDFDFVSAQLGIKGIICFDKIRKSFTLSFGGVKFINFNNEGFLPPEKTEITEIGWLKDQREIGFSDFGEFETHKINFVISLSDRDLLFFAETITVNGETFLLNEKILSES